MKVLFFSQGEKEAQDLVGGGEAGSPGKAKFIYLHLPDFLRLKLGRDTAALIDFPATGSVIEAMPSTEKAGRSTDATRVVRDELERHPYGRENFASIGPTIDAGGQLIDLSTADKFKADSHFKERYKLAKLGKSNAYPVFLPWHVRPVREEGLTLEEWYQKNIIPKYTQAEREQEYPASEDDALGLIEVACYFDVKKLEQMDSDIRDPLFVKDDGFTRIYREPIIGRNYVAGGDVSDGSYTYSALTVLDTHTSEIVATIHCKIRADKFAQLAAELGKYYNNALLGLERNQPGYAANQVLKDLKYPNIYYMDKDKAGWWTAGGKSATANSRGFILNELKQAIMDRTPVIYNKEILFELRSFLQSIDEEPRAARGAYDDFVMALAITWQLKKHLQAPARMRYYVRSNLSY